MTFEELKIATINHWRSNGLYGDITNEKQCDKLREETVEVEGAFEIGTLGDQKTEIGDCLTVIINLCQMNNFTPEECLQLAYSKNKKRYGKMLDGEFLHDKTNNKKDQ